MSQRLGCVQYQEKYWVLKDKTSPSRLVGTSGDEGKAIDRSL